MKKNMVESVKGISFDNTILGITTVKPNHSIKKCRIRKLRIEYHITKTAVILVLPKSCGDCNKRVDCTDDFIIQIIEKSYTAHKLPGPDFI